MSRSTLSSKGQVTIPKEVRDALHLEAGDRVLFVVREDGVAEIRPQTVNLLDLVGMLRPPDDKHVTAQEMDEAIGEALVGPCRQSVEE